MRRYAREVCFCKIYENLMTGNTNIEVGDMFNKKNLTAEDEQYIRSVVTGSLCNKEQYSAEIEKLAQNFKLERIFKVDHALLVLAMQEISKTDTPHQVAVNEILELAKKFSTEKSVSFINGILAQYIKQNKE